MCNAKPGTRCASESADRVTAAQERLRNALIDHAQNVDDPAALETVRAASQELWVHQLELAGAQASAVSTPPGENWWNDAGVALQQAHRDQEALMPVKPPADAPKHVKDAYRALANARDHLARRDAIEVADHLAFTAGTQLPPEPQHGPRPALWDVEMRVAQAERVYHQAVNPGGEPSQGESWRLLMHEGHMPYDPYEDASHPGPRESAPWVQIDHTRPVAPGDLASLRRVTGQHEHIDWDLRRGRIVVHPDPYGDAYDHTEHVAAYQRSLWQVGYSTTMEDGHIVIHSVPDLPSWRGAHARRATAMQAAS